MTKTIHFLLVVSILSASSAAISIAAHAQWSEEPGWDEIFGAAGVDGTIAVLDQRDGADRYLAHNPTRAGQRYIPASTFKVPHALFALDAGVVCDVTSHHLASLSEVAVANDAGAVCDRPSRSP